LFWLIRIAFSSTGPQRAKLGLDSFVRSRLLREVDRFKAEVSRGALVRDTEDFAAVIDSLIACKFLRKCFAGLPPRGGELLSRVTDWNCWGNDLRQIGERIHNVRKLFNIREGWTSGDDWLPKKAAKRVSPYRNYTRDGLECE
jgi:aldehyde:ferredoxin oxidoreductase